jgi:epoxide hydrolase-like predicted phosphatase
VPSLGTLVLERLCAARLAAMPARAIDTVIFDFGGVLARNGRLSDLGSRFPAEQRATAMRLLMGDYGQDNDHPWHRLERGEITLDEHRRMMQESFAAEGISAGLPQPGTGVTIEFVRNQPVVTLVEDLRAAGFRLGVLTNNVREFRPNWWPLLPFEEWFDDIVDSHEVGMRKPNPAIYQLALARLGAEAGRTAFLDDVATNVSAATGVGMHGVWVDEDPSEAVATVRRWAASPTEGMGRGVAGRDAQNHLADLQQRLSGGPPRWRRW